MSPLNHHVINGVPVVFGQENWDKEEYEEWLDEAGYEKGEVEQAGGKTTKARWTHEEHTDVIVWYSADDTRVGSAVHDGDKNRSRNTYPF